MKNTIALSLSIFLLTGALHAAPFAVDSRESSSPIKNYPNGMRVYTEKDGRTFRVSPDGTKTIIDRDAQVTINPDGSKIIKAADGTIIETKDDGTKIVKKKDGTTVLIHPDGTKIIKNADGSTFQFGPKDD